MARPGSGTGACFSSTMKEMRKPASRAERGSSDQPKRARRPVSRYLGVIFIAAVLVPSVLLAVISLRAAGREEAYAEMQLSRTLLAEDDLIVGKVNSEAEKIGAELGAGLDVSVTGNPAPRLSEWKKENPLVGVPFLVTSAGLILWPSPSSGKNREETLFLQENKEFLSDRAVTPVYQNIAFAFQDTILAESERLLNETNRKNAVPATTAEKDAAPVVASDYGFVLSADAATVSTGAVGEEASEGKLSLAQAPFAGAELLAVQKAETSGSIRETESEVKKAVDSLSEDQLAKQKAVDLFAQSDSIRSKVYKEAQEKGDVTATRVVQPAVLPTNAAAQEEQSQYISEGKRFSQITAAAGLGIIPRFVGEKLTFLFWEKQKDGGIAGCEIAGDVLRPRIAGVIAGAYSPTRIVAILDELGEPLSVPTVAGSRDWRRPFVSQEIGEAFPRWEVASYLTSPEEISARARASSLMIWIMVLILFVSVAGGGTLVLTSVNAEMRLARNKSTFVTNVSHELKTPLTSISLFVELLRTGRRTDPKKVGQYLSLISGETERLTRLINNVLDFSSIERGRKRYNPSVMELVPVCRDLIAGQKLRLESQGFSVEFLSCAQSVFAEADAEAVKQAVLNLVSNAEKYSPEAKAIEVAIEREEGFAVIHVRDRGSGVPEKLRERIFQEFFRVDDSLTSRVKGTGLGLTIARKIARDLGGDLTCAARAGGGSDFALRLPAPIERGTGR